MKVEDDKKTYLLNRITALESEFRDKIAWALLWKRKARQWRSLAINCSGILDTVLSQLPNIGVSFKISDAGENKIKIMTKNDRSIEMEKENTKMREALMRFADGHHWAMHIVENIDTGESYIERCEWLLSDNPMDIAREALRDEKEEEETDDNHNGQGTG